MTDTNVQLENTKGVYLYSIIARESVRPFIKIISRTRKPRTNPRERVVSNDCEEGRRAGFEQAVGQIVGVIKLNVILNLLER